jgi:N-acyl homoserine lactone hydrolase
MAAEIIPLFTGLPAEADGFVFGTSSVTLVRSDGRLILFDTGPYAYRPILQGRLRRLGVDPGTIDTLVLSHLHWDSASNADLFPNADVIVHERELAAAGSGAPDAARPAYLVRALRKLKLKPIDRPTTLSSDLKVLELPGHTPGSIGLVLGTTLFAGDAVVCAKDAVAGRPLGPSADAAQAAASLSTALAMAEVIYPGHDRPFRTGARLAYIDDYELRIRLFVDPEGEDEELRFAARQPKSFATWPD